MPLRSAIDSSLLTTPLDDRHVRRESPDELARCAARGNHESGQREDANSNTSPRRSANDAPSPSQLIE